MGEGAVWPRPPFVYTYQCMTQSLAFLYADNCSVSAILNPDARSAGMLLLSWCDDPSATWVSIHAAVNRYPSSTVSIISMDLS